MYRCFILGGVVVILMQEIALLEVEEYSDHLESLMEEQERNDKWTDILGKPKE